MKLKSNKAYWFIYCPENANYGDDSNSLPHVSGYATRQEAIVSALSYYVCETTWKDLQKLGYKLIKSPVLHAVDNVKLKKPLYDTI
jgi:hypothetical protein